MRWSCRRSPRSEPPERMVRRRFTKLPPEQQRIILRAALKEFATHGFHDASLNRMIEAAGISKGSLYYYFDGKEDLYAYLAQSELTLLFGALGPFSVPDNADADAFWSTLESYYLRSMTALSASPEVAALVRGWAAASRSPALQQAQQDIEQAVLPWLEQTLAVGQRVGAVRDDLPSALLISLVVGMGQAMDIWLISQKIDQDELPGLIASLIEMIRGAVGPARVSGDQLRRP